MKATEKSDTSEEHSHFVVNRGARIHFQVHGDSGSAVVLIAGAGTDSSIWRSQIEELEQHHLMVAIDPRGSGQSERPAGKYTAELFASDLEAVVKSIGLESFALVGYSMGGLIAQRYFVDHPEQVERLALLNCTLGGGNSGIVLPEKEVVNTFLYGAALAEADVVESALDFHFGHDWSQTCPELAESYRSVFERNAAGIFLQVPILVSAEPLITDPKAVKVPVLAVFSRDDVVTPVANAEVFAAFLPQARVEILAGHHASMLIHPKAINQLLAEFLACE